jgi:hypothetical protein
LFQQKEMLSSSPQIVGSSLSPCGMEEANKLPLYQGRIPQSLGVPACVPKLVPRNRNISKSPEHISRLYLDGVITTPPRRAIPNMVQLYPFLSIAVYFVKQTDDGLVRDHIGSSPSMFSPGPTEPGSPANLGRERID